MLSSGWFPAIWNLYADVSEHSVVRRNINRDDILAYLYGKNFGSKITWPNQKEGDGKGAYLSIEKQAVEGKDPKMEASSICVIGNVAVIGSRKGSHRMVEI